MYTYSRRDPDPSGYPKAPLTNSNSYVHMIECVNAINLEKNEQHSEQ